MSQQALAQVPNAAIPGRRGAVARRIRFVSRPAPEAAIVRSFQHPRSCAAVAEPIEMQALLAENREANDHLIAIVMTAEAASEAKKLAETWIGRAGRDGAIATIAYAASGLKLQWQPGKAVIQAAGDAAEQALTAVVEFSFHESELRRMEETLAATEAIAPADVARAHRIRFRDRKNWRRIGDTIEALYRMRLEYARLEAQLISAPSSLPGDARDIFEHLLEESELHDRMEAFSNRLEACEDLYEGANDRVTDHRWYLEGHALEIGIILLLIFEVALMSADLYLKHWK